MKEQKRKENGVTLVALIITVIVMLILASVSISAIVGNDGIITQAVKAKFFSEIKSIQEELDIKNFLEEGKIKFGSVNGILEIESIYNSKLAIENGKLVYIPENISEQEKEWLEELGIKSQSNYYLIMMNETKLNFEGHKNIGTIEEFGELVNSGTFNYDIAYIIEDISLNNDETSQWTVIGSEERPFQSTLDGGNYTISGLYLEAPESMQGMFGYNTGTIKNIKLENFYVYGTWTEHAHLGGLVGYNSGGTIENCHISNSEIMGQGNNVGGLVGCNDNGIIKNCSNSASITNTGQYATSGIVGWSTNESTINNCFNSGNIIGQGNVSGIVGALSYGSSISNCYNTGYIKSNGYLNSNGELMSYIGGVVGSTQGEENYVSYCYNLGNIEGDGMANGGIIGAGRSKTVIEYCYNKGNVLCNYTNSQAGGIVGNIQGILRKCYNEGKVTGIDGVGGIVGMIGWTITGTVENCYNTGEVIGTENYLGGIAGRTYYGSISNCYNIGNVIGTTNYKGGISGIGEVSSEYTQQFSNCYYLKTTCSGAVDSADISGKAVSKTVGEMKDSSFVNLLDVNNLNIWSEDTLNINNGFPVLNW